jgi:large subunit ribosomal protein L9
MEVILLEKVKNLGNLGDKVVIRAGYGRNYLIPKKKAILATQKNLAEFETRRVELELKQKDTFERAKTRAEQLQEMTVVVASKVGLEGKLFGSVSASDIAYALSEAGIEVTRQEVRLPQGPIRYIGDYEVVIHLHTDVDAKLKVKVIAEDE